MSYFLVVRGPLGAGKTTVARALAAAIGAEVVAIDDILDREAWDGGSEELFLRANVIAAEEARPALERGVPVVFDGNFYWQRALDDLARRLPFPHTTFTLDVPIDVCRERDRRRPHSYGEEGVRAVYAKCARVRRSGVRVDGRAEVDRIVAAIRARLPPTRRAGRRGGTPAGPRLRRRAGTAATAAGSRARPRANARSPPRRRGNGC